MHFRYFCLAALLTLLPAAVCAQSVSNGTVRVAAVGQAGRYVGFDLTASGETAAVVRLSSDDLITAKHCSAAGGTLRFSDLTGRPGSGLSLGPDSAISVTLHPHDPYLEVTFRLSIVRFSPAQWVRAVGKQPFHFLALFMPDAQVWHQRGWLNATPVADPFPLLGDVHVGSPEISAYPYNRNWSYTPPLGANPLPVIGLWAPQHRHYAAFEFQTTRLEDNSEKSIAAGYCWHPTAPHGATAGQFVALVYPYGGQGYQQLVFPTPIQEIQSHSRLVWSLNLGASQDPNRFLWQDLWSHDRARLPRVPAWVDLSWLPGGIRLRDFAGPAGLDLVSGVEGHFQVPGTLVPDGWDWRNESPIPHLVKQHDAAGLLAAEAAARRLLPFAKHFQVQGEDCVFWEKPMTGQWTPEWGGKGVTTLHNANGFAIGRLFLGLYRYAGLKQYLPIVDGVFHWAQHVTWTRAEFADVPSSPFAIGGTLSTSFCLDYYAAFKDAPDALHRRNAREALDLARSLTYRYMVMWPSDNNRDDALHSAFLWEPNSGRDWTGAACANEVFWNLDTLAQAAVQTGDPVLTWALQGSLDRWHELYQDVWKPSLAQYGPGDMDEGYGLYAGNIYGVGKHSSYGFASPLAMTEPVGNSIVRVLAGEKAALVFHKGDPNAVSVQVFHQPDGSLTLAVRSRLPHFDLSLTTPYRDISGEPVFRIRGDVRSALQPGMQFLRPPQALWSLYFRDLQDGDRVVIGRTLGGTSISAGAVPLVQTEARPDVSSAARASGAMGGWQAVPLPFDSTAPVSWNDPAAWAGLSRGVLWASAVAGRLAPAGPPDRLTDRARLAHPIRGAGLAAIFYNAGAGPRPALVLSDGAERPVDTPSEALAWEAWPPLFTEKLLVAPVLLRPGETITGVDPRGRQVWAVSILPASRLSAIGHARTTLISSGRAWRAREREEALEASLEAAIQALPRGSFAVIPPLSESAGNLLAKAGLEERGVVLTPDQLIDPNTFNPQRFPAAIYLDGEQYLDTVHTPGDASDAVKRYVAAGGMLILAGVGPFPMYYAMGPGGQVARPLPPQLGLPIQNAVEMQLPEPLRLEAAPGGTALPGLPLSLPYPSGDTRLRSINPAALPPGAAYAPAVVVRGASDKSYGDAAGLLTLPGGGRILYVWGGLLRDPDHDYPVAEAIVRLLQPAAH